MSSLHQDFLEYWFNVGLEKGLTEEEAVKFAESKADEYN